MPSRDVNNATRLAEARWRRDKMIKRFNEVVKRRRTIDSVLGI